MQNRTRLKRILFEENLSQKWLSENSGLDKSHISKLVTGQEINPTKNTMGKVAKSLKRTVDDIFFAPINDPVVNVFKVNNENSA